MEATIKNAETKMITENVEEAVEIQVIEIENPNAVMLVDEGKQFVIKTDCKDPETLFMDKDNFLPMIKQVKKIARGLVADVHTENGYKARKALNAKLAKLKNAIEDEGKKVAAALKAKPKKVDETRRTIKETLEMLQEETMAPIRAIEARQAEIVDITNLPATAIGCDSAGCQQVLEAINSHEHDANYWDESYAEAMDAIKDARRQVEGIKASAEKQEAERAELEKLRAQQAEFEKAAREKAEAEKREAEEQLRKAQMEAQAAKLDAERAKQAAAEAEKLTHVDCGEADARATRESMLFPSDEQEYKRLVNREVLEDLQRYGIGEELARQLITDIVHGKVRHLRVMY